MSVVVRGVKNAFRNWLRTLAVVLILAIGIGLSMSMLVANEAVNAKITDLKASVGTSLTVSPAGGRGFEGGGEPLTADNVTAISKLQNVSSASAIMSFRLQNKTASSSATQPMGPGGQSETSGTTSLSSAIDAGTLGRRNNSSSSGQSSQVAFSMPITGVGSAGISSSGDELKITSGRNITAADTENVAVVGSELATKNSLSVGSTFTAYDKTFTVVGIYDQGTKFENAGLVVPLAVAQTLTGNANEVSSIIVKADSADNVASVQTAIKSALGSDKVDVTSSEATVQTAIDSLKGVQQISIIAFVGALIAAAVIIFLIMMMIVRERKREIGVLKAIGGSNRTIVTQFIVESLVLVVLGAVVGLGVTMVGSNSIANALISSSASSSSTTSESAQTGPGVRGGATQLKGGPGMESATKLVGQVATNVGWTTIAYAALATIAIAVVGSAVPAWLISKVRPAVVLRGE